MDYAARIRELCLSFPGAHEEFPWGEDEPVYKNENGKIFVFGNGAGFGGTTSVTVKLTREEAAEAKLSPFVTRAHYLGRLGWVLVQVRDEFEWQTAEPLVRRSHELTGGRVAPQVEA